MVQLVRFVCWATLRTELISRDSILNVHRRISGVACGAYLFGANCAIGIYW